MNTKICAGIYIRLSREDEKEKESSSIESQREYLLSYLKEKGYPFIDEYVDDGYTGTNFERPGFKRLLHDIKIGKINMVVVKDLSRLGRNNSKVSFYLEEYFPIYHIRCIAINNDYDSFIQNASKEYAWLTNGMNESYCLDISKKVRSALYTRKKKGYFTGWKAPYGYKRSEKDYHKLIIDEEVCDIVRRIFQMAYNGKSPSQIADILSSEKIPNPSHYAKLNKAPSPSYELWCSRTIAEMLNNETYIGNLTQGRRKKINYKVKKEIRVPKEEWIIIKDTHPAIVDKNTFYTVQSLLKKSRKSNHKNNKLLSGFFLCKECGHSIGITKSKDQKRFYLGCTYYRKYSKFNLCTPHTMNYQKMEDIILNALRKLCKENNIKENLANALKNNGHYQEKVNKIEKQIYHVKKDIKDSNKIIDRAYIDMQKGILDLRRYQGTINELNRDIKQFQKSLNDLEKELISLKRNKENKDYLSLLEKFLKFENPSRTLLANLIDKIYISKDKKIEIYFKFKAFE